ncbi:hypothetical protein HAP47_0000070 [Bradyrhizobium sp. 41S5]|uniref:hypothetical protein n=1 Tax=Bradyrhizobium sp. 41S5 TaxID=1404443 RepID=UPI00156B615A|nr:hypothetical protein [Bradyrhizobium sp. 41S5]UFX45176.1 hypothetical protein HAP47_0000070 [Bradyrhizobium sp. 41S5]
MIGIPTTAAAKLHRNLRLNQSNNGGKQIARGSAPSIPLNGMRDGGVKRQVYEARARRFQESQRVISGNRPENLP